MKKPCIKCLLAETDMKDLLESVKELIRGLPDEERVSEELYAERLEVCKSCDMLRDGTCGACGCFAELRAAKRRMGCPEEKWLPCEN